MAKVKNYDYTNGATIKITNIINKDCYKACDAGSPVQKVEVLYSDIKDKTCAKFDYLFNSDGSFKTKTPGGTDYVVALYQKFKNTDREVPAYRTRNAKIVLKAADAANGQGKWIGDSMKFSTDNKDEIVFYEKFAEAFIGELEVSINDAIVGSTYPAGA